MSIDDRLDSYLAQISSPIYYPIDTEQAKKAILTDLLEMLKVLCEDDKIKAWNFLEQYVGMKENTK